MTLLWKGQNWIAAAVSPPLGLAVSLIAWLVTAKKESGVLNVTTTGANYPMLAGNVAALLSPIIFVPFFTYVFGPQNYDYESMRAIRKVDDTDVAAAAHVDLELVPGEGSSQEQSEEETRKLNKAALYSRTLTVFMAFAMLILWPIPMYGTSYVFSKKFFTGWVVVGIIWLFCTLFGVVVFPLYEGRESITRVVRMMILDLMGKKPVLHEGKKDDAQPSGVATPAEQVEEKGKEVL
jgi:Na+/proline symporter